MWYILVGDGDGDDYFTWWGPTGASNLNDFLIEHHELLHFLKLGDLLLLYESAQREWEEVSGKERKVAHTVYCFHLLLCVCVDARVLLAGAPPEISDL